MHHPTQSTHPKGTSAYAEALFADFMIACGVDPASSEHLTDTPKRFTKLFCEQTANYGKKLEFVSGTAGPGQVKATTFASKQGVNQLIVHTGVTFNTICAHHLSPFMGVAHIGYLPNPEKGIIGLSKLSRVLDFHCLMPQTQELLTEQTAEDIMRMTNARFVAVVCEAEHTCVSCRGVRKMGATMITSAFRNSPNGAHQHDFNDTRAEFLQLIRRH